MLVSEIINEARNLKPTEKYIIIESLVQDLSNIDKEIEKAWIEESQKRLKLFEAGKLDVVSYEEVFSESKNF